MYDRFGILDVNVAEVSIPVLVTRRRGIGEFAISELFVDFFGSGGKFVENPEFAERFVACTGNGVRKRFEVLRNFAEYVFGGLVNFVTEAAVAMHHFDVKINISAFEC